MRVERAVPAPAIRFTSLDGVRAHLAAGGDEMLDQARELARGKLAIVGDGSFVVHKGAARRGTGWLISHSATGQLLTVGRPFPTKRRAVACAEAGKYVRDESGELFDWDSPGFDERVRSYRGPNGEDLGSMLARVRRDVELAELDRRKAPPTGPDAAFPSVAALRVHIRSLPAETRPDNEERVKFLTELADDPTLEISARGQIVYRRPPRGDYFLFTARTLQVVAWIDGDAPDARALADWLESTISDADNQPFPFGVSDVRAQIQSWRSKDDNSFREEVAVARGDFDVARGVEDSLEVRMAASARTAQTRRRAIAGRAADGGYVTLRPHELVKHDQIEFEVPRDGEAVKWLIGSNAPDGGETITLCGTLAKHAEATLSHVRLSFVPDSLTWSQDGHTGAVRSNDWLFSKRTGAHDCLVCCRRPAAIAAIEPEMWETVEGERLAQLLGVSSRQLTPLSLAMTKAINPKDAFARELFLELACRAAASYYDIPVHELDRELMAIVARLDEYEARGQLKHPWHRRNGEPMLASELLALAAERLRRHIPEPSDGYSTGARTARSLHADGFEDAVVRHLDEESLRGACDYLAARVAANANWVSQFRTPEIDADGAAWRALRDALERERTRRASR